MPRLQTSTKASGNAGLAGFSVHVDLPQDPLRASTFRLMRACQWLLPAIAYLYVPTDPTTYKYLCACLHTDARIDVYTVYMSIYTHTYIYIYIYERLL